LLTGEIGSGKTTLIRYLLNQVHPDLVPAVIFNTNLNADQLLCQILQLFGVAAEENNKPKNLQNLDQFLLKKHAEGRNVLLIIDEAQNLTDETLEEIRMLSNIQSEDRLLLQIILVGQPELKARFKNPALAQLSQRIAVNYHLQALTLDETRVYIVFRLKKAGGRPDIFTPDAMEFIFRASNGIPRTINLLCDSALVYGFADEIPKIHSRIIKVVIRELGFMGLYDRRHYEKPAAGAGGGKIEGNGFLHRLEELEEKIQKLQSRVERQNAGNQKGINDRAKELITRLKIHLQNERKRSIMLMGQNKLLKQKLREIRAQVQSNSQIAK